MIVLGIDPALIHTGWGVVKFENNNLIYMNSGTIVVDSKLSIEKRLTTIFESVSDIIHKYKPDYLSIEETFVNSNPLTSLKLGEGRGASILAAGVNNIPVVEYSPNCIKKTITGVGKAEKQQVINMIKILLPNSNTKTSDEADALAIAICHINHL